MSILVFSLITPCVAVLPTSSWGTSPYIQLLAVYRLTLFWDVFLHGLKLRKLAGSCPVQTSTQIKWSL